MFTYESSFILFFQWLVDDCSDIEDGQKDYSYVEVYLSPKNNTKYTLKFCFSAQSYGKELSGEFLPTISNAEGEINTNKAASSITSSSSSVRAKQYSKQKTTSSNIENETIDKGHLYSSGGGMQKSFKTVPSLTKTSEGEEPRKQHSSQLELFSAGTQILVRFCSSDGRFPSKGFRAKYKTGKHTQIVVQACYF